MIVENEHNVVCPHCGCKYNPRELSMEYDIDFYKEEIEKEINCINCEKDFIFNNVSKIFYVSKEL